MKKVIVTLLPDLIRDMSKILRFSCVMCGLLMMIMLCMVGCVHTTPVSSSQQGKITTDAEYNDLKIMHSIARYQNRHATPFEMNVLDSLSATEIGTFGDGGRYADFLAPSTFASVQLLKSQMDSVLKQLQWSYEDSLRAAIKFVNDHPELGDEPNRKRN